MSRKDSDRPLSKITDEEIGRMLSEREGGRIAGRGDSPFTQDYYEELHGLNPEKRDWILGTIIDTPFYNTKQYLDYGRREMKPRVRKYSLPRELVIKAEELGICIGSFGEDLETHMNRISFIIRESMKNGWDSGDDTEPVSSDSIVFAPSDREKFSRQAKTRFSNRIGKLEYYKNRDDADDEYYLERTMACSIAFEVAYLCLRSETPEETCELFRKTVMALGALSHADPGEGN